MHPAPLSRHWLALLGSLSFAVPAHAADECDRVLTQGSAYVPLEKRGADVARCLDLANELSRAVYENSFPSCRRLVLSREQPTAIELPTGVRLEPSIAATTWEDFALHLGEGALQNGCRDGIRSALHQTLFSSAAAVQALFASAHLQVDGLLVGDHGRFIVDASRVTGFFTGVQTIETGERGKISFHAAPLELLGAVTARIRLGPALQPLVLEARVTGVASGTLDTLALEVAVQDYKINSVEVLSDFPSRALLEDSLREELEQNKSLILTRAGEELTQALRLSYSSADPFAFLQKESSP